MNFMSDFEIYVDNYSFSAFLALKLYFDDAKKTIIENSSATEDDHYMKTLALVCRALEINLKTMPIQDQQKLEEIVRRYSKSYKRNIGRGNNSRKKNH